MEKKRLYKIEDGKKIFGVCGGLAEYFDVDPTLVRVLAVALCLAWGAGAGVYVAAAILLPKKSQVL